MTVNARGPSGYLLLLGRTFDSRPLGFYSDRGRAEEDARSLLEGYDPNAPVRGRPETGRGELGPPGLVSRIHGITLIPYVEGSPLERGRSYFSPELPDRDRGRMLPTPATEGGGVLEAHGVPQRKPRKRKGAAR